MEERERERNNGKEGIREEGKKCRREGEIMGGKESFRDRGIDCGKK